MDNGQLTVYRGCTPVIDAAYAPDGDHSPAEVIIDALAEVTGVDPLELPPLYNFIDPEALDQLFARHSPSENVDAILGFTVEQWNVFVRADGRIRICDARQPSDPQPVFEPNTA